MCVIVGRITESSCRKYDRQLSKFSYSTQKDTCYVSACVSIAANNLFLTVFIKLIKNIMNCIHFHTAPFSDSPYLFYIGKIKEISIDNTSSYRRITVTGILANILERERKKMHLEALLIAS